jgi:hypothetical protein
MELSKVTAIGSRFRLKVESSDSSQQPPFSTHLNLLVTIPIIIHHKACITPSSDTPSSCAPYVHMLIPSNQNASHPSKMEKKAKCGRLSLNCCWPGGI